MAQSNATSRGALFELYTNSECPELVQLRDKGWCVIRSGLSSEAVGQFVNEVDNALETDGFPARFGRPMDRPMMAKDLPQTSFWSIDTIFYPLSPWAIALRHAIRDAFACRAGVDPTSLASSFDGVMMKDGKYSGQHRRPLSQHEVDNHLIPCGFDPKKGVPNGPTHCDQNRYRRKACESHQIFCPLKVGDLSTIMLVPDAGWTLQGVIDTLTEKFPEHYNPDYKPAAAGKRKRASGDDDPHDEGYFFPVEHRDYLLKLKAVKMIKPQLDPGDLLIWSSALPHCNGLYPNAPNPTERSPRLGIITAFAPKALMSDAARETFARVVGRGYATGQQVLYPSKHGSCEARIWRYTKQEDVPRAYHNHRAWRASLVDHPLWESRDSDTPETAEMRSKLRCLLGM